MIGEALRLLRVFHDEKLVELAGELDLSPSYLSEIENGKRKVNLETIERYAKHFNIRKSAILFFAEEIDKSSSSGKLKASARAKIIKFMQVMETAGSVYDTKT